MAKEQVHIIKASITALCEEIVELAKDGWNLEKDFPRPLGWQYEVVMTKGEDTVSESPRPGRPKLKKD